MDVQLSVIIVNFNVRDFLSQTLRSVRKATQSIPSEIIVVDNHSSDGSSEIVEREFPEVLLLKNSENVGFARANNQALEQARGKFLVLLNPDTIVQEDTFQTLIRFFDNHPDAGMAGCKILNPDGTLQLACRRSFPTPWVAFTKLVGLSKLFPGSKLFGRYNLTYLNPEQITEVDAISGSFMMLRREVYRQVGPLDERFFMYGEDLDWCYRVKQAQWKIYYVPETKIIHYKGTSSGKSQKDTLLMFYRAMLQFVQKHFRGKYLFLPQWFLITGIAIRGSLSFLNRVLKQLALPFVDWLFLNVALIFGLLVRFGSLQHLKSYFIVDVVYSAVWLGSFYFFDLYKRQKYSISRALGATLLGLIISGTVTFFFKQFAFSRVVVLVMGLAVLVLLPGWRLALHLLAKSGKLPFGGSIRDSFARKKTVLVGHGEALSNLIDRLRQRLDKGYEVAGVVLPRENQSESYSVPVLGTVENLPWIIRSEAIQEVIFSSESLNYEFILGVISQAEGLDVNFRTAASDAEVIIGRSSVDHIGDIPLVDIDYKLGRGPLRILKRLFDGSLSLTGLFFLWPIYFYWRWVNRNPLSRVHILSEKGKPIGVTILGDFPGDFSNLKYWQKIPLLADILAGKISFVGAEMVPVAKKNHHRIYLKPGITGLVQLYRDQNLNELEKEKYELFYLKNYSPFFDVEILAKSILGI